MKKQLINLSLCFALLGLFLLNAAPLNATNFSTETVDPLNENVVANTNTENNETVTETPDVSKEVTESTATVEGVFGKIQTKLNELVNNGTKIAETLCVAVFMISALFLAFDALSHKGSIWRGTLGMICAAVAYTCIKYGPTIVEALSQWFVN